jgi:hypothetical protein
MKKLLLALAILASHTANSGERIDTPVMVVIAVPKPGCQGSVFFDELQARKNDAGYTYSVEVPNETSSYAIIDSNETVTLGKKKFKGWSTAIRNWIILARANFGSGKADSEIAKQHSEFEKSLHAVFTSTLDDRMECVKFGRVVPKRNFEFSYYSKPIED